MMKSVCPQYCSAPFCLNACPAGAIAIAASGKNKNICVDLEPG